MPNGYQCPCIPVHPTISAPFEHSDQMLHDQPSVGRFSMYDVDTDLGISRHIQYRYKNFHSENGLEKSKTLWMSYMKLPYPIHRRRVFFVGGAPVRVDKPGQGQRFLLVVIVVPRDGRICGSFDRFMPWFIFYNFRSFNMGCILNIMV